MGKVDQLNDAVHDGIADRNQGIQSAKGQPVHQLLQDIDADRLHDLAGELG
jgi:hypothetical protein